MSRIVDYCHCKVYSTGLHNLLTVLMSIAIIEAKENLKDQIANLDGISKEQQEAHWKVYMEHVEEVNNMLRDLNEARNAGKDDRFIQARRRRLGHELSSVYLHEIFFSCLVNGGSPMSEELKSLILKHFGGQDNFMEELVSSAKTRGIGWTVLYYDKERDNMYLTHTEGYENSQVAGLGIVFCLDHFEHGYLIDNGSGQGASMKFFETIKRHICWKSVEERFKSL
ncbi:hypothetical protein P9112_012630 [Eukaryota sp. TZLM1-RC]